MANCQFMTTPDDFITTREAMVILGYTNPSTVARMVYEGKLIPVRQIGGKGGAYIFDRKDVEDIKDSRPAVNAIVTAPDSAA